MPGDVAQLTNGDQARRMIIVNDDGATGLELVFPDGITVNGGGTVVHFTIPYTGTAYTAGDCLGGEVQLADAVRIDGGAAIITAINLRHSDASLATPAGRIHLYSENPAVNTADNAAVTEQAGDAVKECGAIDVAAGDWAARGSAYTVCKKKQLYEDVFATNGKALFLMWKLTNTPDFTAASGFIYGTMTLAWIN